MRCCKVLLLSSRECLPPESTIVGDTPLRAFGDSEVEDYIELLSACNIPFEIIYQDKFSFDTVISHDAILYSKIILTVPTAQFSETTIHALHRVSHDFGVSLIASDNRIHDSIQQFFGIQRMHGKRYGFPVTISVHKHLFTDPHIGSEITLGTGLRLPLHKGGLRRHPTRYLKKHLKTLWEQVWSYQRVSTFPEAELLAVIKGTSHPAIVKYQYGKGVNYYIALQADSFLDTCTSLHRIVRECIRKNSGYGMASVNMEQTMVLRMDDPGTCERVYLKGYDTTILGQEDWETIFALLKRYHAALSVMYIPLWVDDGNRANGRLFISGQEVTERQGGTSYPSKDVVFLKNNRNKTTVTYDYPREFLALQEGGQSGQIEIESHGLTHLDPHLQQWAQARDRYANMNWYHEFRHVQENQDCSEHEQTHSMQASAHTIQALFGTSPTVITPSGHEQSCNSEEIAHHNGYKLFSSAYHAFWKNGMIIRNNKIRSIFFEEIAPNSSFVKAGYPVVGVFHDYDLVKRGIGWLETTLTGWQQQGITRFMTLRELAGYLCASLTAYQEGDALYVEVDIFNTGDVSNRPENRYFSKHTMDIEITLPQGKIPEAVVIDGTPWNTFQYDVPENRCSVTMPPFYAKDRQTVSVRLRDAEI
jgi:hypothetical protein